MATMAADPVFVDTNILVYVSRPTTVQYPVASAALSRFGAEGTGLWISRQVLREYLSAVTRPQATAPAIPMTTALADVRRFQASFEVANDSAVAFDRLLELLARYPAAGSKVHDANLVATMLEHGIRRLLTFNVADFSRFSGLIELEPLPVP